MRTPPPVRSQPFSSLSSIFSRDAAPVAALAASGAFRGAVRPYTPVRACTSLTARWVCPVRALGFPDGM